MSNNRLNRERTRLHFAFSKATSEEALKYSKYKSRVEKAPMLIYNNGLGNALAFIYANNKKEDDKGKGDKPKDISWNLLYAHIHEWLNEHYLLTKGKLGESPENLAGQLLDDQLFDEAAYRAITREVLKLLEGLKRFAKGEENKNKEQAAKTEEA